MMSGCQACHTAQVIGLLSEAQAPGPRAWEFGFNKCEQGTGPAVFAKHLADMGWLGSHAASSPQNSNGDFW